MNPDLAPDVAARVKAALSTSEERANLAIQVRQELRAAMDALLKVRVGGVRDFGSCSRWAVRKLKWRAFLDLLAVTFLRLGT